MGNKLTSLPRAMSVGKMYSLYERISRIKYSDKSFSLQDLLKKDNSVSIHHKNMLALATEMFKVTNNTALEELFIRKVIP